MDLYYHGPRIAGGALIAFAAVAACLGPAPRVSGEPTAQPEVVCTHDLRPPIEVRIEALDPVEPGARIRLRVTAESTVRLGRGTIRLLDSGGATPIGNDRTSFSQLTAHEPQATDFAVRMPADGSRALVQVRLEGEGSEGILGVGATLNLLPEGPTRPDRVVSTSDGRVIAEHAAGRMAR